MDEEEEGAGDPEMDADPVLSNCRTTVPSPRARVKFRAQHSVLSHTMPRLSKQQHHWPLPQKSMVYEVWIGTERAMG